MTTTQPIIEVKQLKTYLGNVWVHQGINFLVQPGEVFVIMGGSGSGKTVLIHELLSLRRPTSGSIRIFNQEMTTASAETLLGIQRRLGVLFQQNALFSSLTVLENVAFPLKEHTALNDATIRDLSLLKILLAGLPLDSAIKYPSELSGGMQKRAALARAIVLDPELIFLDEPTAGLDPHLASELDELIIALRRTMGLTIVIITHDLDTLWRVTDRVAFLGQGKVLCVDAMDKLVKQPDPTIHAFFSGARGRVAEANHNCE